MFYKTVEINGYEFVCMQDGDDVLLAFSADRYSLSDKAFRRALVRAERTLPGVRAYIKLEEYLERLVGYRGFDTAKDALRVAQNYDKSLVEILLASMRAFGFTDTPRDLKPVAQLFETYRASGPEGVEAMFPNQPAKPQALSKRNRPGFVYVLHSDRGDYKIGRTIKPKDRSKIFGVVLPFHVEFDLLIKAENYTEFEAELHSRFEHKRTAGEWFSLTPEDLDILKAEFADRLVSLEALNND